MRVEDKDIPGAGNYVAENCNLRRGGARKLASRHGESRGVNGRWVRSASGRGPLSIPITTATRHGSLHIIFTMYTYYYICVVIFFLRFFSLASNQCDYSWNIFYSAELYYYFRERDGVARDDERVTRCRWGWKKEGWKKKSKY